MQREVTIRVDTPTPSVGSGVCRRAPVIPSSDQAIRNRRAHGGGEFLGVAELHRAAAGEKAYARRRPVEEEHGSRSAVESRAIHDSVGGVGMVVDELGQRLRVAIVLAHEVGRIQAHPGCCVAIQGNKAKFLRIEQQEKSASRVEIDAAQGQIQSVAQHRFKEAGLEIARAVQRPELAIRCVEAVDARVPQGWLAVGMSCDAEMARLGQGFERRAHRQFLNAHPN